MKFFPASGLPLGEIYYMNVSGADTVLAAQDTWYQVLVFDTNGDSHGAVTPDYTNGHITAGIDGKYWIYFSVSSRSVSINTYHFMVRCNNGAKDHINIMAHRVTSVAGRIGPSSCGGYDSLSANDTVELWVRRTDGGAVSKTITIEHVTLNACRFAGK